MLIPFIELSNRVVGVGDILINIGCGNGGSHRVFGSIRDEHLVLGGGRVMLRERRDPIRSVTTAVRVRARRGRAQHVRRHRRIATLLTELSGELVNRRYGGGEMTAKRREIHRFLRLWRGSLVSL